MLSFDRILAGNRCHSPTGPFDGGYSVCCLRVSGKNGMDIEGIVWYPWPEGEVTGDTSSMQRSRTGALTLGRGTQPTCRDSVSLQRGHWGIGTPAPLHSHFSPMSPVGQVQPEVKEDTHAEAQGSTSAMGLGKRSRVGKEGERACRDTWKMLNMYMRQVSFSHRNVPHVLENHGFLCLP